MFAADKRQRLPNELLAEMVSAMPAGIAALEGITDFMDRMEPLAAFIQPRMRKSKREETHNQLCLESQEKTISIKYDELNQAYDALISDMKAHLGMPFDQAKIDEFDRRHAALKQQRKELSEKSEELSAKFANFDSAWERSKQFAKELAGEDKTAGDNNVQTGGGGYSTVCEANSRKRKKPAGNGAEEELAEETKLKKAKIFLVSSAAKMGKRLPNELLAEMVSAMPAGISSFAFESDFMKRMEPLSAFINPFICKFESKLFEPYQRMKLQEETLIKELNKCAESKKTLEEMPDDQVNANRAEFDRQLAAFHQQRKELLKEAEDFLGTSKAYKSAWKRSIEFAEELTNINRAETICEASSSRKRKNSAVGNEEEELAEETTKLKKVKAN